MDAARRTPVGTASAETSSSTLCCRRAAAACAVRLRVALFVAVVRGTRACLDTDCYFCTDLYGYGCHYYGIYPNWCDSDNGDDYDFTAGDMCCACGGGFTPSMSPTLEAAEIDAYNGITVYVADADEDYCYRVVIGGRVTQRDFSSWYVCNEAFYENDLGGIFGWEIDLGAHTSTSTTRRLSAAGRGARRSAPIALDPELRIAVAPSATVTETSTCVYSITTGPCRAADAEPDDHARADAVALLPNLTDVWYPGVSLYQGDAIVSNSAEYTLLMQSDGNLVLSSCENQTGGEAVESGHVEGSPTWATDAGEATYTKLEESGDLVTYKNTGYGLRLISSPRGVRARAI